MGMRNAILIAIVIALFLIPFVSAGNPLVQTSNSGMSIVYTKVSTFKAGINFTMDFHVFNSTNLPVTNTTASCAIHLYNSTGGHFLNQGIIMGSTGIDWEVPIPALKVGTYGYIVQCNNTREGGFASADIFITQNGYETADSGQSLILIAGLLVIIALSFLCFYLSTKVESVLAIVTFATVGGLMLVIAIFYLLTVFNDSIIVPALVDAWVTFVTIMAIAAGIAVLALLFVIGWIIWKGWKWKTGREG